MKEQIHIAAQYLAAAGISFLEKRDDDSHTNLGFNIEKGTLETHLLSAQGDLLSFNYKNFSLEWESLDGIRSFPLDGKTHPEVLQWIEKRANEYLGKTYQYNLHYDLPYSISDTYRFLLSNAEELNYLCNLRTRVVHVLERVIEDRQLKSPIRVWPHHFDSGGFSALHEGSDIAIGFGMAIPDAISNDHYYYIGAYQGHDPISPKDFKRLTHGNWMDEGFVGAILPVSNITEPEAIAFFNEAIDQFIL